MKLVSLVPIISTPDPSMIRISSANLSRSRRCGNAVPLNTDTPNRTFIISPSGRQRHDRPGDDRLRDTVVPLRDGDNACPRSSAARVPRAPAHRGLENAGSVCHGRAELVGRCAMSQLDVAENNAAVDVERASVYVPPLQRTEGQPPPMAANGGLSYMAFDQDGDAGTAKALQDVLAEIAAGEDQRV